VVESGPGLAFVVYPAVVAEMSSAYLPANLWAFAFFTMLVSLALGSVFGAFETVITAACDSLPTLREHKSALVLALSSTLFLFGLIFTCGGGIHAFTLFNASAPSWNLLLFALLEVLVVAWAYGAERAIDDLSDMDVRPGRTMRLYWRICWKFITPAVLAILLVTSLSDSARGLSAGDYRYPTWVQVLGVAITASTTLWLPAIAISHLWRGGCERELRSLLRPTPDWKGQGKEEVVVTNYSSCQK